MFPIVKENVERAGVALPGGVDPEQWDILQVLALASIRMKAEPLLHSCDFICADEGARSGYLGVSWGLGGGNAIGAPPLVVWGTPGQKERWLYPVLRGSKRCCLGVTEPSGGSDVAAVRTTAKQVNGHWLVNGQKKWITNGIDADFMTTAVRTGDATGASNLSFLIIPLDAPGVTRRPIENTGVHASGSAYITLENVE